MAILKLFSIPERERSRTLFCPEYRPYEDAFLQYLRRRNIKFIWVLEFQTRGASHYHVLTSGEIPEDEIAGSSKIMAGQGEIVGLPLWE
jgi:hypothetical protein